ncbi:hypothetical protein B0P06_003479 [Clostridium saccharoperbutylacetonicum]|uniref:PKD domain-containing protein n=1 Tax=Clostridium saccharoperbutylacetonicum N1-4(HMT) TaxID=931276 RepID=M1MJX9_9CLOT|nr:hypothetical protein [Clostridium saccharoperbutylacetonicum]AGF58209.1 hypothetical protein Cspa_c44560 [Clostridium saccharoperbutylacetonicum N1-4(HMT)]NRT61017.1 hypothetical protein [Clostridium saccharoperbutylacetonicum]NSB24332.1 hypothetical protein [Clostridium saccharoperbutylacetonicum]NSB43708.1 hypothetical protein [Clostridium saccharoperbutylacetonicum]
MLKKFLGITLTMLLCLPSSVAFANSNVNSSSEKFTTFTKTLSNSSNQNSDYKKLLANTNIATGNKSSDLLESEKVVDSNIKIGKFTKTDVNDALLSNQQNSTKEKINFKTSNSIASVSSIETTTTTPSAVDVKPIAQLRYAILNPASLKNGQITTDTQIAWLWSYNGQNYTYDPNGYKITNVNIDGTPGVSDSIIGTLTGNIGFATQFKTPGQYILKFKCMNDHNVWSDEWSISISVEPTDNNTRPQCVLNYSALSGNTDTEFFFSWANSKDNDNNDSLKNVQSLVIVDGETHLLYDYALIKGDNSCIVKFKKPGTYPIMVRVSDSHGAWSNWVGSDVVVTASTRTTPPKNTPTPNNISIDEVWSKIKHNPKNNTPYTNPYDYVGTEAYNHSSPSSSEYLTSCTDNLGYAHNYYKLTLTQLGSDDVYLIYDDEFLTSNEYHNGYSGTWFPKNSINFKDGVMTTANLNYQMFSGDKPGEHKKFHIFDFYTAKDYTITYFDGYDIKHPYRICSNMTDNTRIVYQQDGFNRYSLDRQTGKITIIS